MAPIPTLRPATTADCDAILEVWNPFIRNSDVTFNSIEKTPRTLATELAQKEKLDQPLILAVDQNKVLGFATYGQFRASNGYRRTLENTIILAPNSHGLGIGRRLMTAIEDHARKRRHYSMFAGISHRNPNGVAFHAALGYAEVARLPEVGYKFDQWYDLILMQKIL